MSSKETGVAKVTELVIGSVSLTEREIAWIKVAANLSGTSIRAQISTMVKGHLLKFTPKYHRDVAYLARKYGITWEEAFDRLAQSPPPLGEVVSEFPAVESEEKAELANIGLADTSIVLKEMTALINSFSNAIERGSELAADDVQAIDELSAVEQEPADEELPDSPS